MFVYLSRVSNCFIMHVMCFSRSCDVWLKAKEVINVKLCCLYAEASEGKEEKWKGKAIAIVSEVLEVVDVSGGKMDEGVKVDDTTGKQI